MSRVLDEIVQEIESKAPVLKRQREEYESMQRSMASLCNKLEQARTVWKSFHVSSVCPSLHSSVLLSADLFTFLLQITSSVKLNVYFAYFLSLGDLQFAERERGGQAAL